jgi:acylphosphatase
MYNKIALLSVITGLAAVGLFTHIAFAQVEEQTLGQTYMALALSIVSIAGNVFNAYLAQKAKLTGQAPNETDAKIAAALASVNETLKKDQQKYVEFADFLYNNAVPEKAKAIVEGSLPLIKVQALNEDVKKAEGKFNQANDLLRAIQGEVEEKA